jgi:AraC-like DNA-binding protein
MRGTMQGTNTWMLVRPLVELACRLGLDRRAVIRRLGVTVPAVGDVAADQPITIDAMLALWADAGHAGDASIPLELARGIRLDDLGVMGFTVLTAPTGREAFARAVRYAPLITTSGRWVADADPDGEHVRVRWVRAGERTLGHRLANEAGLAQFIACLRELCGPAFAPTEVTFRHAAPDRLAAHRAFFRAPLAFGADADGFRFRAAALAVTPPSARAGLAAFVCAHADAALARITAPGPAGPARDAIDRAMAQGDRPRADRAARALGVSPRTLRRRLAADGARFSRLVDDTVRVRAHALVTETARPLTEIAIDLGFSDSSAFSHAFRRWYGCAPRELRARGRADQVDGRGAQAERRADP